VCGKFGASTLTLGQFGPIQVELQKHSWCVRANPCARSRLNNCRFNLNAVFPDHHYGEFCHSDVSRRLKCKPGPINIMRQNRGNMRLDLLRCRLNHRNTHIYLHLRFLVSPIYSSTRVLAWDGRVHPVERERLKPARSFSELGMVWPVGYAVFSLKAICSV
jgi:hypothetical protein